MLKYILLKEVREMLFSRKFVISFIVCSILIILTFYSGARQYQLDRTLYETAVSENLHSMEGITDWRMIEHTIYLPPHPLASLVSGISNDIGRSMQMHGLGELTAEYSKYNEDPVYAVFRFLDLTFLFQIILSLFAILFAYDAISGEKERGTMRLVFSNTVSRSSFILGKILGTFLSLVVPLLIPILLGCLLLILLDIPMSETDWLKLGIIIGTGFLFFGTMIAISLFVSTITKKTSSSFLFLLIAWILFILVLPRGAVLLSGRTVDVPNVDEINNLKNNFSRELSEENFKKMESFESTSKGDMQQGMNEFQQFMTKISEEKNDKMNAFTGKLNEQRQNAQLERESLAMTLAGFSPSALFTLTASEAAGTSLQLMREYIRQANEYQKVFANFQKEKTGETTGGGMSIVIQNSGDDVLLIDPQELPVFEFKQPEFAAVLSNSLINIGILFLFTLAFYAASFFVFLKYDLR